MNWYFHFQFILYTSKWFANLYLQVLYVYLNVFFYAYVQVTLDLIKEAGLEKVLKSFHSLLDKAGCGEAFVNVPRSVYLCEQWANKSGKSVFSCLLDICPNKDHYVFGENDLSQSCPKCGLARSKERQMLVGHADTFLREMFKQPDLAKALRYPLHREPGDGDCWDAELLKLWTELKKMTVLPLCWSSDAAVLQMWKQRSFTPVVAQLLSLPPHLRTTFHGNDICI